MFRWGRDVRQTPPLPGPVAVELRFECTLHMHSLAPRGTSGERGNPIKPSSSPPTLSSSFVGREGEDRFRFRHFARLGCSRRTPCFLFLKPYDKPTHSYQPHAGE